MTLDSGATAWILASTCLVMLMTPAVGLFYGGLVRRKNVISMVALAFLCYALVSVQWVFCGYSLAFGPDISGFIGGLDFLGLSGIGMDASNLPIPDILFAAFQMVFAALTLAILTSGVAERIRISAFVIFGLLWTTLVYDPLAHWAWVVAGLPLLEHWTLPVALSFISVQDLVPLPQPLSLENGWALERLPWNHTTSQ
jgi:Amt family ammonium transporter